MKFLKLLTFMLLVPSFASAQCSTHARQLKNPLTWLKSNMCANDYNLWVQPRLWDHWYKDKYFWMGTAVIAGAVVADAHSTATRPRGAVESNPLLGFHPTTGKIVGVSAANFGINFALHAAAWHESHQDPSQAWRQIGRWGVPVASALTTGRQAALNYELTGKRKCREKKDGD